MNLEQLQQAWSERERALDQAITFNGAMLRATLVAQHRASAFALYGMLEPAFYLLAVGLLGAFIGAHLDAPRFALPAALLALWSSVMLVVCARQRRAVRTLDYGDPVLMVQKRIEAIRSARLRTLKWSFLSGQVLWYVPFLIVLCQGVFGLDLYALMPRVLAYHLAFSLAMVPLWVLIAPRLARRMGERGIVFSLADALAGTDLQRERAFLGRLRGFERA